MARDSDDDALSWGDAGDPTYLDSSIVNHSAGRSNEEAEGDVAGPGSPTSTTPSERTAPEGTPTRSTRPSLAERRARAASTTSGATAGATADGDLDVDADIAVAPEPQGLSSVMLLTLGVLGGVYLLYTVGWFTSATRTIAVPIGALDAVMAQVREYLSVAAPALWFASALLLTRAHKSSTRVLLLILGAIVLLPLPFVLGV